MNEAGESAKEQYRGRAGLMYDNMKENVYVKLLAGGITKKPEGFAEIVGSGRLHEVYEDFKEKNNILQRTVSNEINEVEEDEPHIKSEDITLLQ